MNEIARAFNADGVPSPGRLRYERGVTKAETYRNACGAVERCGRSRMTVSISAITSTEN